MRIPSLLRGNRSEAGKTRTCITAKGHERAKCGGGGTRRYNDTSFLFQMHCTVASGGTAQRRGQLPHLQPQHLLR